MSKRAQKHEDAPDGKRQKGDVAAWTAVPSSEQARRTFNPIRAVVDTMRIPTNPPRPLIKLSIGDPTVFGNMNVPEAAVEAVAAALRGGKSNGYVASHGAKEAREAVARRHSTERYPLTADDVVIASGCSGAISLVMPTLANPGENVLLPRPGFSLYETVCKNAGIEVRYYDLLPGRQWEADVASIDRMVDARTRALLVNNPSNPCGSNYSEAHLRELAACAARHRLPIVADEIYADMVFSGQRFTPMAAVSDEAPVLVLGGLAKQYLVPGWRCGWVAVHDRRGRLEEVRRSLVVMSQVVLGANTLVQAAIPAMLTGPPPSYYAGLNAQLERQAGAFADAVEKVAGLRVVRAQACMYVMVGIDVDSLDDAVADDRDFAQLLMDEEQVFVLPGQCFGAPNFFRAVICAPEDVLRDAAARIEEFMKRHRRK